MRKRTKSSSKREKTLDQKVEEYLQVQASEFAAGDWQSVRERMKLQVLYPGQYVAYRDHFEGKKPSGRLVWREVVKSSRSLAALHQYLDRLSQAEQQELQVGRVDAASTRQHRRSIP